MLKDRFEAADLVRNTIAEPTVLLKPIVPGLDDVAAMKKMVDILTQARVSLQCIPGTSPEKTFVNRLILSQMLCGASYPREST